MPRATEIINSFSLNCPPYGILNDYTSCDVSLTSGTNLNVTIDYGDGSVQQIFTPTGKAYFFLLQN